MVPLIGYANKLSARPGETLDFKVSSSARAPYEASLVRIRCADPNPEGPGIREEKVAAAFEGRYPSRRQEVRLGSHAVVEATAPLATLKSFTISATIWPTAPEKRQAVISWGDGEAPGSGLLGLDHQGRVTGEVVTGPDGRTTLHHQDPMRERQWYRIWLSYDGETRTLALGAGGQLPAVGPSVSNR